jgi:hypothetical protein
MQKSDTMKKHNTQRECSENLVEALGVSRCPLFLHVWAIRWEKQRDTIEEQSKARK